MEIALRVLSRKIYRAFPELDQFDDETCIRYMHRVWGPKSSWKFLIILIALVPIALIVWVVILIATSELFDLSVYPEMSDILTLMLTGFVWFPLIVLILARDFWVLRQIRKHIDGAGCKGCDYCLVGLKIKQSSANEYVLCPECGDQNVLDGIRICKEDIDPSLLTKT